MSLEGVKLLDSLGLNGLEGWLKNKGFGRIDVCTAMLLAGGTQNVVLRLKVDGRDVVLRRPPVHLRSNSNSTIRREIAMLSALAQTNVRHPKIIASCSDETDFGFCFYIMECVNGFSPIPKLPAIQREDPDLQRKMGLSFVEALAVLGEVDHLALGLGSFGNIDNYLSRQVSRWQKQLDSYCEHSLWPGPSDIPGIEKVASWLESNCPKDFTPGILHGDYHLGNVLFDYGSSEVAAIIDWELTAVGDPLVDLGWLLATWPRDGQSSIELLSVSPWLGFPDENELVEHYASICSRDLTYLDWYRVLACFKLGIILEGTYARSFSGQARKEEGEMLHRSTVNLFKQAITFI